ncbi:hypothetical protein [Actinomadura sp. DC4]|uniref:hypothetical protein n=1 Tax=Actinomadura sp. DC4 TaxID=3055069 RepID=UPI0025B0A1F6|nr:hypothetical protein [Actinomadura sp. DC4]MDN3353602.1 hypothetical protein [Actinomadura sp. DC4]
MPTTRTIERTPREHGAPAAPWAGRGTRVEVPVLGTLTLPRRDQLVFFGGLGLLAVVGVIEWPVAAVVGTGHLLAARRNSRTFREVGEALEQA